MISFDFHDQNWLPQEKKTQPAKWSAIKPIEKRKCENICAIQFDEIGHKKTTATYSVRIRSSHGFNATCHRKCHGHTQMEQKKE